MTATKQTTLFNYYSTTKPVPAKRWKIVFKTSLDIIKDYWLYNEVCAWHDCEVKINKLNVCDYNDDLCNKCYEEASPIQCQCCLEYKSDCSTLWREDRYETFNDDNEMCLECYEKLEEEEEEQQIIKNKKKFKTVLRAVRKLDGNPLKLKDDLPEEFLAEERYEYIETEEFSNYIDYLHANDLYGEPHIWKEYQANLIFQTALNK